MRKVLEADYEQKQQKGGILPKLSVLDKLVIMLQYCRECRTMWHIAFDYGIVKSTISDSVVWAEQMLIKSRLFRLPSKRELLETASPVEVAIVDATFCVHFSKKMEILAGKGYQWIVKLMRTENHRLTAEERKINADISKRRIYIEPINRYIKRFRILSSRYRNKRKKFALRAPLICAIFKNLYSYYFPVKTAFCNKKRKIPYQSTRPKKERSFFLQKSIHTSSITIYLKSKPRLAVMA